MGYKIALFYGGASEEHEVSIESAKFIRDTLKKLGHQVFSIYISKEGKWFLEEKEERYPLLFSSSPFSLHYQGKTIPIDIGFPIIHGKKGEDGSLQGFLEFVGIPYAGANILTSSIGMHKVFFKNLMKKEGIPVVPFLALSRDFWEKKKKEALKKILSFSFPIFIKPSSSGSSIRITKIKEKKEDKIQEAIEHAFSFDKEWILIEKGIKNCWELEISILGKYPNYIVSRPGRVIPSHEFYSYEAKYLDPNGAILEVPAKIEKNLEKKIKELAKKVACAVYLSGFCRVDFFYDPKEKKLYVNEINTLPGFTPISLFPKLFIEEGYTPEELLEEILEIALLCHQEKGSFGEKG